VKELAAPKRVALHIYRYHGNFSDPEYVTTIVTSLPQQEAKKRIEEVIESKFELLSYTIAPMPDKAPGFYLAFHEEDFEEVLRILNTFAEGKE